MLLLAFALTPQLPTPLALPAPDQVPVLFDTPGDGRVWARGHNYKASFGAEGVHYIPVSNSSQPAPSPVHFQLESARLGDRPLPITAPTSITHDGNTVEMHHGPFRQAWNLTTLTAEQTFIFDSLPATGDLVISIAVDTALTTESDSAELRFHSEAGFVTYGAAVAFDSAGRGVNVQRTPTDGGFELRVPSAFVAQAALPLVVDPIVSSTFAVEPNTSFQLKPDAAFGRADFGTGHQSAYLVTWEQGAGSNDRDIFSVELSESGIVIPGTYRAIDISISTCSKPKVAYNRQDEVWMVVYERRYAGGTKTEIEARRNTLNSDQPWSHWSILTGVGPESKSNPDVGGFEGHSSDTGHAFTVVWEEEGNAHWTIRARQVGTDGAALSNILDLSNGSNDARYPAISSGAGVEFFGSYWHNIAWTKNPTFTSSSVQARRITTIGATLTPILAVSPSGGRGYAPGVSETLDTHWLPDGSRPFMVAYKYEGQGLQYVYTCDVGNAGLASGIPMSVTEGLAQPLDANHVSVAGMGKGATVAYATRVFTSAHLYASTGNFSRSNAGGGGTYLFGLGERALRVSDELPAPRNFAFASEAEGGGSHARGAFFWGTQFGAIMGAMYEGPGSLLTPVLGVQSCAANANSTGERGWVAALGLPNTATSKTVVAEGLPSGVFGYLLVGETAGFGTPANSEGRICIGGGIGRYLGQIQASDAQGTMSFDVDPTALPQPNGWVAAAPGENYYFQVWHRDMGANGPTSNFTNALEISFE